MNPACLFRCGDSTSYKCKIGILFPENPVFYTCGAVGMRTAARECLPQTDIDWVVPDAFEIRCTYVPGDWAFYCAAGMNIAGIIDIGVFPGKCAHACIGIKERRKQKP